VLVDAPCSGLGTLSKKPDAKWNREKSDIDTLSELQRAILKNAAGLVKPGGVLVYSTCTTEPEENSATVEAFLASNPEFEVEHARPFVPENVVNNAGFVETFPHVHSMDGSFAARFRKRSDEVSPSPTHQTEV
jgi:16S rRNA (cytosine967-C5)-methyltransferase